MKVIIIEDETRARSLLKSILISSCQSEVTAILEASDLKSGVQQIKEHQPEIVFLDIEMPHEHGTEILRYFDTDEVTFEIVFTTAYSDFALKAFEMNAIDYLLKPLRPTKVKEVVQRIAANKKQLAINERLLELKRSLNEKTIQKLGLPVADGIMFVDTEDIVHIAADGMYTKLYRSNDEELLISKPLKFYEKLLTVSSEFFRPHRSHIINLKYLSQYVKRDGHYCLMSNGNTVPIVKDKREDLLRILSEY